jgi:hypothetical protein
VIQYPWVDACVEPTENNVFQLAVKYIDELSLIHAVGFLIVDKRWCDPYTGKEIFGEVMAYAYMPNFPFYSTSSLVPVE